jgi:hypothetical protein
VKPVIAFLAINLAVFLIFPFVRGLPEIEDYRPAEIEKGNEVAGGIEIFKSLLVLTGALIIMKILKVPLRILVDVACFSSGYFIGEMFGFGILLGLLILSLRKSESVILFNISSAATIVGFSLIIAPFMTPEASMVLMALLGLYDVVGVLYFPYIKFLWLETKAPADKKMDGIALIFEDGMVGAGDFVVPIIFSLSFGMLGLLSVPLLALGFVLNGRLARIFGAFPGLPFQAFFAYGFFVAFS